MNNIFFARRKTGKRFRFYKEILTKVASIPIAFKTTIVVMTTPFAVPLEKVRNHLH